MGCVAINRDAENRDVVGNLHCCNEVRSLVKNQWGFVEDVIALDEAALFNFPLCLKITDTVCSDGYS